jgi:hypothetical protein
VELNRRRHECRRCTLKRAPRSGHEDGDSVQDQTASES